MTRVHPWHFAMEYTPFKFSFQFVDIELVQQFATNTNIAKRRESASVDCVKESKVNVLTQAVFSLCFVSLVSA